MWVFSARVLHRYHSGSVAICLGLGFGILGLRTISGFHVRSFFTSVSGSVCRVQVQGVSAVQTKSFIPKPEDTKIYPEPVIHVGPKP